MDGVNCTQCDELKKRVNHIEYEDLKEIRGDIQEIREDMAKNHVLLKQNIDSSERLNNTLTTVQNTMIQLSENIKHTNETTSALSSKVSNLEEKIDKLGSIIKEDLPGSIKVAFTEALKGANFTAGKTGTGNNNNNNNP